MAIKQINFNEVEIQVNQSIILRPVSVSDAEKMFMLIDKNRTYLDKHLPWVKFNTTENDSYSFLKHCQKQHSIHKELHLAIIYQQELCGLIGLEIDLFNNRADIGYWTAENMSGKGIMTISVSKIVEFSFKKLKLNKVIIKCNPKNIGSKTIAEKNNFMLEGVLRQHEKLNNKYVDLLQYSLLQSEFIKS